MVSLIGEQPIPNLLPIRYLNPEQVLLLYTDRTSKVNENLKKLITDTTNVNDLPIDPYNIQAITQALLNNKVIKNSKTPHGLCFNLTGGTKPMAFAAYQVAERLRSHFIYLQSERHKSILYHYEFSNTGFVLKNKDEIPEVIEIDDYLKVHGFTNYSSSIPENPFETAVSNALNNAVKNAKLSEVKTNINIGGSLEIDLIIRHKNQIGVAEVKSGKAAQSKQGIDQLNTASEQRFLGTYVTKFLILDRQLNINNQELAKAHRIIVIVLSSILNQKALSVEDKEKLIRTIQEKLTV
jgi:Holliday junction resolvase-like predicted endonuclease